LPHLPSPRRPAVRVALLLAVAEIALLYCVYNPDDLAATSAVAAWTLILSYVVVMLVHFAESAGRHREQLYRRQQAENRETLDALVDALVEKRDAAAARDAVRLVRGRYDAEAPPSGGCVSP